MLSMVFHQVSMAASIADFIHNKICRHHPMKQQRKHFMGSD
jgi:hypothetical protein